MRLKRFDTVNPYTFLGAVHLTVMDLLGVFLEPQEW